MEPDQENHNGHTDERRPQRLPYTPQSLGFRRDLKRRGIVHLGRQERGETGVERSTGLRRRRTSMGGVQSEELGDGYPYGRESKGGPQPREKRSL